MMMFFIGVAIAVGLIAIGTFFATIILYKTVLEMDEKLKKRVSELENKISWEPPSVDVIVRKLVQETDNYKSRCPRCKVIIVNKPQYCPQCGENFFKEKVVALPRILSTHVRRVTAGRMAHTTDRATLHWECLECKNSDKMSWGTGDLMGRNPFIYVLHCNKCKDDVGDLIIDPALVKNSTAKEDSSSPCWAVNVTPHGKLRLSDYIRA